MQRQASSYASVSGSSATGAMSASWCLRGPRRQLSHRVRDGSETIDIGSPAETWLKPSFMMDAAVILTLSASRRLSGWLRPRRSPGYSRNQLPILVEPQFLGWSLDESFGKGVTIQINVKVRCAKSLGPTAAGGSNTADPCEHRHLIATASHVRRIIT